VSQHHAGHNFHTTLKSEPLFYQTIHFAPPHQAELIHLPTTRETAYLKHMEIFFAQLYVTSSQHQQSCYSITQHHQSPSTYTSAHIHPPFLPSVFTLNKPLQYML